MRTPSNLFRKIGRIPLKIRVAFYRKWNLFRFFFCGIKYGRNLKVSTHCNLHLEQNAQLIIGDDFRLSSGSFLNPLCRNLEAGMYVHSDAKLIIGNNVGMSSPCLWARKAIIIGNHVNIGGDTIIMDCDAHSLDYLIRRSKDDQKYAQSAPIVIEDDVFIGTRSIILKGVTIGARSIIAAGSVVTKSIPADCIAGGNPCQIIRRNTNV